MNTAKLNVAVVGLGYWGPNRLRALSEIENVSLRWICERDADRLARFAGRYPVPRPTTDFNEVVADEQVEAVIIATPVSGHYPLAKQAIEAGKHVFVEKPLAGTSEEARELAALADDAGLTLACGHTFLHSPPVQLVKEILDRRELGDIHFVSSSRVNLGPYRSDVSVLFDLGPHDFSILRYWFDSLPEWVRAVGRDVISPGVEDVAFVDLTFPDGLLAHVELSWLAPSKLRRTVLVGSEKMLVYEDGAPEPVRLYDSGIEYQDPSSFGEYQLSYRTGDIVSLRVDNAEPIMVELMDFVDAVIERRSPVADADLAIDVIRVVEAAAKSMGNRGTAVQMDDRDAAVQISARIA